MEARAIGPVGAASGAQHDVVDVVRGRTGARRAGTLFVNLDLLLRCAGERNREVVDGQVGIGVERSAVLQRVDRLAQRLEVVAHYEERATRSICVEQIADTSTIGRAGDRRVVGRHEVERSGSKASSLLASAWWRSISRPRRWASAATRSSARCEMSLAVTF